jgi:hypothetical protein
MTEDVIYTLCHMAHCYIRIGDRDKAADAFGRARSLAATTGDRALIAEVEYDAQALDRHILIDVDRGEIIKVPGPEPATSVDE